MPKIEKGTAHTSYEYWTVLVDADELQCDVRKLPYPTWIGTIQANGKINVWTPAASVPRGYRRAALAMLEEARKTMIADGRIVEKKTKIVAHYDYSDLPHKDNPLPWQEQGLQYTRSGYGSRIPTARMVQLPGSNRWRRVYCCIWSNIGTCYVEQGDDWVVIQ